MFSHLVAARRFRSAWDPGFFLGVLQGYMGLYSEYIGVIEGSYRVIWGLIRVLVSSVPRGSKILSLLFKVVFVRSVKVTWSSRSRIQFAENPFRCWGPIPCPKP